MTGEEKTVATSYSYKTNSLFSPASRAGNWSRKWPSDISRRRSCRAGGGASPGRRLPYSALNMMGLLATPNGRYAAPPQLTPGSGNGKRVVILGAGIAGMTAALPPQQSVLPVQNPRSGVRGPGRGGCGPCAAATSIVETDIPRNRSTGETHRRTSTSNTRPARLFQSPSGPFSATGPNWASRWSCSSTTTAPALIQLDSQFAANPRRRGDLNADLRGGHCRSCRQERAGGEMRISSGRAADLRRSRTPA